MFAQRLWGAPFEAPAEVVGWLGAMQAQEFPVAKWSIAQRAGSVTDAALNRLYADGAILRTHLLRPTWHFVLPADIRWLLDLTAPRVHALNAYHYRRLGLDDADFARSNALLAAEVAGGAHRTRAELAAALQSGGVDAGGLRMAYLMMRAELDAVLVSGAPRGAQHTYAAFDERVPDLATLDRERALAELARRFFTARGPATVKDLALWSSLTVADAKRGLAAIESELHREEADGRTYWFAEPPAPAIADGRAAAPVDVVQGYDEVIMSYSESKDVLGASWTTPLYLDTRRFLHAVLLDGRVIGHWRPVRAAGAMTLETVFHRPLRRGEARALDAAVERHAAFLGAPVTVRSA